MYEEHSVVGGDGCAEHHAAHGIGVAAHRFHFENLAPRQRQVAGAKVVDSGRLVAAVHQKKGKRKEQNVPHELEW